MRIQFLLGTYWAGEIKAGYLRDTIDNTTTVLHPCETVLLRNRGHNGIKMHSQNDIGSK